MNLTKYLTFPAYICCLCLNLYVAYVLTKIFLTWGEDKIVLAPTQSQQIAV